MQNKKILTRESLESFDKFKEYFSKELDNFLLYYFNDIKKSRYDRFNLKIVHEDIDGSDRYIKVDGKLNRVILNDSYAHEFGLMTMQDVIIKAIININQLQLTDGRQDYENYKCSQHEQKIKLELIQFWTEELFKIAKEKEDIPSLIELDFEYSPNSYDTKTKVKLILKAKDKLSSILDY